MLSEFDLIARYFTRPLRPGSPTSLGIGDDCALLAVSPGMQMAISSDMLVEGRHFFAGADAAKLGHKSLAVNLSDLGAMGAKPLAFTLALSLPQVQPDWLDAFSRGLFKLAEEHGCELIGGDTTKGPLNICITVFGEVPAAHALRRDAARPGDDIWVSGSLGDASLALAACNKEMKLDAEDFASAMLRLDQPTPRVALGMALRGIAHASIDVSDGLIGDLGHILKRSGAGAVLDIDALPVGRILAKQAPDLRRRFALAGGDDYELCFAAPAERRSEVEAAARQAGTPITRVGRIRSQAGLQLTDAGGAPLELSVTSFDHFAAS